MLANIEAVGSERSVLSSDLGQTSNPSPRDGFEEFLDLLSRHGVSERALDWMTRANPLRTLGLWEEHLQEVLRLEQRALSRSAQTPYRSPLMGFAAANDALFGDLKKV